MGVKEYFCSRDRRTGLMLAVGVAKIKIRDQLREARPNLS